MRTIGILGGMGPQASAKLLELIVAKTPQFTNVKFDDDFPEIVLLNVAVPNFINNKKNFQITEKILLQKTKLLEDAGCKINGIACNTAHLFLPALQKSTNVPFLSIPKLLAERIYACGFLRVGLLGTPNTLRSTLFDDELRGLILVRPDNANVAKTEQLILQQIAGTISQADSTVFRALVKEFIEKNKLDAVILGCTELPLIFGDDKPVNVIDTLDVLAEGLVKESSRRL